VSRVAGRYEIVGELGRGGMATVHLARQPDLDRLVALKELSALASGDSAAAARFLREARVAGALSHPNVVTVHDFFEHDGTPFIAMEYVPGGTLRGYQADLEPAQRFGVLLAVLAGLAHAARHGIVHRDLKPENLLVNADGHVKIADFGIAKAIDSARSTTRLTVTGTTIGTPDYIAPEQAMGAATGPRSDLYALGCIAFEQLTGRPPFADADSSMGVLLAHVNSSEPALRSVDPAIDTRLADWVDHMTAREPEDRPSSAVMAAAELEDIALETLGARWRSSALLVPELADAASLARPRTTARFDPDPQLATTLPPTRPPTGRTAPLRPDRLARSGRRARRAARGFVWAMALVGAVAAVLARTAGPGEAPGTAPRPAASVATDSPATGSASPGTRPAATASPTATPSATASRTATPAATTGLRSRHAAQPQPGATPRPSPTATPDALTNTTLRPARSPSCVGDSASDDPSDDDCDGGEP